MKLYLIRHGTAVVNTVVAQPALSDLGWWQVEQLAHYLAQHCSQPPDIFHSGILRAQQTAEFIAQHIQYNTLQAITGLRPQDTTAPMLHNISSWQWDTLLVGHLPYMQKLLWDLVGDPGLGIEFSPATAVCLEQIDQRWQIQWQFSPAI